MKVIRGVQNKEEADKLVAFSKKLPGVTYAKKYIVGGKYHCIFSGEFGEDVEKMILGGRKNLANK